MAGRHARDGGKPPDDVQQRRQSRFGGNVMDRPDIEHDLCDLADMANVTDILVEMLRGEITAVAKRDLSAAHAAEHVEYWADAASFAVTHTKGMVAQLREKYLAETRARWFTPAGN